MNNTPLGFDYIGTFYHAVMKNLIFNSTLIAIISVNRYCQGYGVATENPGESRIRKLWRTERIPGKFILYLVFDSQRWFQVRHSETSILWMIERVYPILLPLPPPMHRPQRQSVRHVTQMSIALRTDASTSNIYVLTNSLINRWFSFITINHSYMAFRHIGILSLFTFEFLISNIPPPEF